VLVPLPSPITTCFVSCTIGKLIKSHENEFLRLLLGKGAGGKGLLDHCARNRG